MSIEKRLEEYTLLRPQEILLVAVEVEGQPDRIMIFKGFSSSLMRATTFDPDIPLLADNAQIVAIDRLQSPYNANNPCYIERGISMAEMEILLQSLDM